MFSAKLMPIKDRGHVASGPILDAPQVFIFPRTLILKSDGSVQEGLYPRRGEVRFFIAVESDRELARLMRSALKER